MDAVDRAHVDAGRILGADAGFADDVRHVTLSSLLKLAVQQKSIPSRRAPSAIAFLAAALLAPSALAGHGADALQGHAAEAPFDASASDVLGGLDGWRESPAHVRLFAPEAHASQYRAFVSSDPLDVVLTAIRAREHEAAPGAWAVEALGPLDAYGMDGRYTPFALSRLYTAGPVRVARGPHTSPLADETWTLTSPYPDPALAGLSPGTLLLVLRIPPL
jgi:hypothetical protein